MAWSLTLAGIQLWAQRRPYNTDSSNLFSPIGTFANEVTRITDLYQGNWFRNADDIHGRSLLNARGGDSGGDVFL